MNPIGERIRKLRTTHNLTQPELARLMNKQFGTSINKGMLSKWENDKEYPSPHNIRALGMFFNISLNHLLDIVDNTTLGTAMKDLRERNGFSVDDIANDINILPSELTEYEDGDVDMPSDVAEDIALLLGENLLSYMGSQYPNNLYVNKHEEMVEKFREDEQRKEDAAFLKTKKGRLVTAFDSLNEKGQTEAIKSVENLTYNPKYKLEQEPQVMALHAARNYDDDPAQVELMKEDLDDIKKY